MRTSSGRIIIQPDWNSALREENGKIWVSYKKQGSPTVDGEIKTVSVHGNAEPHLRPSDNFSVESFEQRKITIKYVDNDNYCLSTFHCPVVTFSSIHPRHKSVQALDVHSGGLAASADSDGNLLVWESDSGDVRRHLAGHVGDVYCCRLFPSGVVVLSGGADMMIKIWSAETGQCAATCIGHRAAILDLAIVDRGKNIISCSKDGTTKLWNCGTQQCILTLDQCLLGAINACALATSAGEVPLGELAVDRSDVECGTDGKILALAGENGNAEVYSLQSRKQICRLDCRSAVNCCKFVTPTLLACGTQDGSLYYWDIRNTETPLGVLDERRSAVLSLSNSPNGLLVSTGDGSCICVKNNLTRGHELVGTDCEPVYSVVHDERFIYTASRDGSVRKYLMTT